MFIIFPFILILNDQRSYSRLTLGRDQPSPVCYCKGTLTFAECLNEAHEVGCLPGAQDLTQGPDVVLGKAERLDLGQFLGFGVTRDDFPQTLQGVVQPMHTVPLPGVSFHTTDFKPAETQSRFIVRSVINICNIISISTSEGTCCHLQFKKCLQFYVVSSMFSTPAAR